MTSRPLTPAEKAGALMVWHYGMWDYGCALSPVSGPLKGGAKSPSHDLSSDLMNTVPNSGMGHGSQGECQDNQPKTFQQADTVGAHLSEAVSYPNVAHTGTAVASRDLPDKALSSVNPAGGHPLKPSTVHQTTSPRVFSSPLDGPNALRDTVVADPWVASLSVNQDKGAVLADLRQAVEAIPCPSLTETAQRLVFGHGDPNSPLMIIGEAPGAEEDEQGIPFVGASGRLLESMLGSIHIARHQVYITNVIPWRPPFNRPPTSEEIKLFAPWLWRHIAVVQPQFLLCVGATATKAVLKLTVPLMHTQGTEYIYVCPHTQRAIPAWTLYHPAYLLRVPGQKKTAWIQLQHIEHVLYDRGIHPTPRSSLAQSADESQAS